MKFRLFKQKWEVQLIEEQYAEEVAGEIEDGFRFGGTCNYHDNIIYINSDMPVDERFRTMLHELYHAACYMAGHDQDNMTRETQAQFFAFAFIEIMDIMQNVEEYLGSDDHKPVGCEADGRN